MSTNFIKNLFIGKIIKENKIGSYKLVGKKNDYGFLLNEMNKISAEYESMPSYQWDIEGLRSSVEKYEKEIDNYINDIRNPSNIGKILPKLEEALLRMAYLLFTVDNKSINDYLKSIDKDIKINYFIQKTNELSNIIMNRINDKKTLSLEDIRILHNSGQTHYLFDIFHNEYNGMSLEITENIKNSYNPDGLFYNISSYINKIHSEEEESLFNKCFFVKNEIDNMTLSDLYYFIKFIGIDEKKFIDGLKDDAYYNSYGLNPVIREILIKAYFNYLDKNVDNRILVMPKFICVSGENEETFVKRHHPFKRFKALYMTSYNQIDNAKYYLEDYKFIKYILIKKSILKKFKNTVDRQYDCAAISFARRFGNASIRNFYDEAEVYAARDRRIVSGNTKVKLIPVNDDIDLCDLSEYLHEKAKTLVK